MKTPPFQAVFFLHEDPPENGHCEGEVCSGYPLQNARVTAQIAPVALIIRESFSRAAGFGFICTDILQGIVNLSEPHRHFVYFTTVVGGFFAASLIA